MDSKSSWFSADIQRMMYAFGDCTRPSIESAILIEKIVLQHLVKILYKLDDISRLRESKMIGIEEFAFLFRKDNVKLTRLIRFFKFKDLKDVMTKNTELDAEDSDEVGPDERKINGKRVKQCYEFLSSIDHNGSLLALFDSDSEDECKRNRRIRLEFLTRQMTAQQYTGYCDARHASFTPWNKMQKFKEWLLPHTADLSVPLSKQGFEILSFLAYEAVGEIVELSLFVRRDAELRPEDPLTFYAPPTLTNHGHLSSSNFNDQRNNKTVESDVIYTIKQNNEQDEINLLEPNLKKVPKEDTFDLSKMTAITTSEIREAMRRLCYTPTPFVNMVLSPYVSQQLLL